MNISTKTPDTAMIRGILSTSLLVGILGNGNLLADEISNELDARYSTALTFGSEGLGVSFGAKTDWSLIEGDHIQWRVGISGVDADFDGDDDVELAGIEYEGSMKSTTVRGGIDWFPFNANDWTDRIFISSGLMYGDGEFDGDANTNNAFSVGDTAVTPGSITSLTTKIESSQVLPYLSLGWGNKITGKSGFDFHAELGLAIATENTKVNVTTVDPGNVLTPADLAAERRDIEDDVNKDVYGFGQIGISYHF